MAIIKLLYTTVNIHLSEIINALAASNGYASVVKFLLASGINPAIRSSDDGQTALDQATSDEIITLLRAAELKQ
jgi:ankyrin repeat protein